MIYLIFVAKPSRKEKKKKVGQTESCKLQSYINNGNHPRNAALAKEIGCLENTNIILNKSTWTSLAASILLLLLFQN